MSRRNVLARLTADPRARRRFGLVTVSAWLLFSLAAGGGLVQYAPDGWIVPVRTWITYAHPTPYGLYALDGHWAVVPVPLYLAQSLGVALLAGVYAAVRARARRCRPRRPRRGGIGWAGGVIGILGAAACCSPIALLLAMLLGSSAAATLTGIGLWVPAAVFALGTGIEARRLRSDSEAEVAAGGQRTRPSASTASAPRPPHTGQDRAAVSSSRS